MTEMEMRERIEAWCDERGCVSCPLVDEDSWCNHYNPNNIPIDQLKPILERLELDKESEEEPTFEVEHDVIKHPNHYCRDGAMECIDEMVMVFGKEVVKHFCLCNIWKYRYRSAAKNGEEDIKKSDQYVSIYKRLLSNE